MAGQAGRSASPPADPWTCDFRRRQRAGTVQVPSVRPQNDADAIANAASHLPCAASRPHYGRSRTGGRSSRPPVGQLEEPTNTALRVPITCSRSACDARRRPRPAVPAAISSPGPVITGASPTSIRQGRRSVAARGRAILAGVKIRTAADAPLILSAARPALLAPATLEVCDLRSSPLLAFRMLPQGITDQDRLPSRSQKRALSHKPMCPRPGSRPPDLQELGEVFTSCPKSTTAPASRSRTAG